MPLQTRTRAQSAAEVATAAAAETVAVNTTDTDTITATENLSQHQTGTLNPTISDPILVDLSSPSDSRSTTGARSVTDAHVMTHRRWLTSHRRSVYSSLLFFVKQSWNLMKLGLKWIFTDNDSKSWKSNVRLNINDVNSLKRD